MSNQKHWILLVEDDADVSEAISLYLKRQQLDVVTATSAREAILKLKKQNFNLIITDIRLKGESGEDVIQYTHSKRTDGLNMDVPIVVISGFFDKELVSKIAGQVQGALVKPFEMKQLMEKINSILKLG